MQVCLWSTRITSWQFFFFFPPSCIHFMLLSSATYLSTSKFQTFKLCSLAIFACKILDYSLYNCILKLCLADLLEVFSQTHWEDADYPRCLYPLLFHLFSPLERGGHAELRVNLISVASIYVTHKILQIYIYS